MQRWIKRSSFLLIVFVHSKNFTKHQGVGCSWPTASVTGYPRSERAYRTPTLTRKFWVRAKKCCATKYICFFAMKQKGNVKDFLQLLLSWIDSNSFANRFVFAKIFDFVVRKTRLLAVLVCAESTFFFIN